MDVPVEMDEILLAALIVGGGFIALEAYYFATLLRAWQEYRRTSGAPSGSGTVDGRGGGTTILRYHHSLPSSRAADRAQERQEQMLRDFERI